MILHRQLSRNQVNTDRGFSYIFQQLCTKKLITMKWKVNSNEKVFDADPYFNIERQSVVLPSGKIVNDYYQIKMPKYTSIIAENEKGKNSSFPWISSRNWRRETYSFPGGSVENNEKVLDCAKRELLEETGLIGSNWLCHGSFVGDASKQCGIYYIYLAKSLKKIAEPESDDLEDVKVDFLTREELVKITSTSSNVPLSLGFVVTVFYVISGSLNLG